MLRLVPILLLLTGCSVFESFDPEINGVGRQIVADWKGKIDLPPELEAGYGPRPTRPGK